MSTATWALALVSLLAGTGAGNAEPAKTHYLKQRDFKIPITIGPEARASISYVQLFVLDADGKTWRAAGSVKPEAAFFPFRAEGDGTYLFKVGIVNLQGRAEPENIADAPIGRKVVVDTAPPQVKILSADRQGEEVSVRWEIRDAYPDPNSAKLEYQFRAGDQAVTAWTPVSGLAPVGQATFKVRGTGSLWVRVQASDLAENLSHWEEAPVSAVTVASATSPGAPALPATGGSGPPPLPVPGNSGQSGTIGGLPPVGGEASRAENGWTPTPTGTLPLPDVSPPVKPTPTEPVAPLERISESGAKLSPPPPWQVPAPAGLGTAAPPVPAATPQAAASATTPNESTLVQTAHSPLPPAKFVNRRQINLDYAITKFGSSGISHVDLYVTRDDGRSWAKVDKGEDVPPLAPPPPDAKGERVIRRSLTVNLAADGSYGFFLVARNGVNRSGREPQSGDAPQIRVEVDTTGPEGGFYPPEVVKDRPDYLLIRWTARDRNLAENPITLEWAETRDGPWKMIAANLPHPNMNVNGQYEWKVPEAVRLVCLRLRIRDAAGNESEAILEHVAADLTEPEVKSVQISVGPH